MAIIRYPAIDPPLPIALFKSMLPGFPSGSTSKPVCAMIMGSMKGFPSPFTQRVHQPFLANIAHQQTPYKGYSLSRSVLLGMMKPDGKLVLSAPTVAYARAGGRKLVMWRNFSHMRPRKHMQAASRRTFITRRRRARRRPQQRCQCRCVRNISREWTWTRIAANRGMQGGIRFISTILWRFGVALRRRFGYLSFLKGWKRIVSQSPHEIGISCRGVHG